MDLEGRPETRARLLNRRAIVAYGVGALFLAIYGCTLLVRQAGQGWPLLDNQMVEAF